jgi:hypothetical protein
MRSSASDKPTAALPHPPRRRLALADMDETAQEVPVVSTTAPALTLAVRELEPPTRSAR